MRLVVAVGIGQIISWGILIYAIAVIGAPIATDLGIARSAVFAAFSLALLTSGLAMPRVGALVDRIGGRNVLLLGAMLAGLGLLLLAASRSTVPFFAAWIIMGIAMAMSLYEAAFATLSQHVASLRRAITGVTLFGGFASTVFIPLALYASEHVGWRNTVMLFAALQLAVNVPMYAIAIPRPDLRARSRPPSAKPESTGIPALRPRRLVVAILSLSFAAAAFVTSSVASQIVNVLTAKGLTVEVAVWVAALIGPMQVVGRIVELATERWVGIAAAATIAFVLILTAMAVLSVVGGSIALACLFVTVYGVANGVITIARGAVPAELFGRIAYGATLGRIVAPSLIARAVAPVVVALTLGREDTTAAADATLLAAAAIGLAAFTTALKMSRRAQSSITIAS